METHGKVVLNAGDENCEHSFVVNQEEVRWPPEINIAGMPMIMKTLVTKPVLCCTKCQRREIDEGKICSNCRGKGEWRGVLPKGSLRECCYCKGTGLNSDICIDGKNHDWIVKENEKWTDTTVEKGETVITARYLADTKTCSKCQKFEIVNGNVITRSGAEYTLEKDGSWGMCM